MRSVLVIVTLFISTNLTAQNPKSFVSAKRLGENLFKVTCNDQSKSWSENRTKNELLSGNICLKNNIVLSSGYYKGSSKCAFEAKVFYQQEQINELNIKFNQQCNKKIKWMTRQLDYN